MSSTAARFWVNRTTRYVYVSNSDEDARRAERLGFSEVTSAEFDTFRAESRAKRTGPYAAKGKK